MLRVAVAVPLFRTFDYLGPAGQAPPGPGSRVVVPFGSGRRVGIVLGPADPCDAATADLKVIEQTLDPGLLDPELLALLEWSTAYYAAPPGELLTVGLPAPLRHPRAQPERPARWLRLNTLGQNGIPKRAAQQQRAAALLADGPRARDALLAEGISTATLRRMLQQGLLETSAPPDLPIAAGPELNSDQRRALAAILCARHRFEALLLAGVTGSGKTEVYLQAARHMLRRGRQVLVLVPEIGLTPQFVRRLEARLGRHAFVYHSGLAAGERLATWQAARSGLAELLIGTRSAVFLPLARPGLIVVDEEHDSSFKQFDGMRYHARDVAVLRAKRIGIPIVLGSATPSLESLHNAERGAYRRLELPRRAGTAPLPHWILDDLRGQSLDEGLSAPLLEQIGAELANGRQILVYRNRRGYAPLLQCNECGWVGECSHCSARLTWHRAQNRLRCHHCGRSWRLPPRCPDCGAPGLLGRGSGTERIETALANHFPDTEILRFDRDSVRSREQFDRYMAKVAEGRPCILVGTRMLAKGHHLPGIGLAVMLDADQALFSADFRAPERLAQSMVQVAGRAGREQAGRFIVQTRHPEHPLLQALAGGNYHVAAADLLAERRTIGLPPFVRLVMVRAEAPEARQAIVLLDRVAGLIDNPAIEIAGPTEAILQRRAGHWRQQLWLAARTRAPLARLLETLPQQIEALRPARAVRWHIDVDPQDV
ncbi:MAG: primosomal protein N' [Wenzhouxiangellaceae bacterium]|nr:primosomal protein N' [Wenzhouxiangellaceae bacterium]